MLRGIVEKLLPDKKLGTFFTAYKQGSISGFALILHMSFAESLVLYETPFGGEMNTPMMASNHPATVYMINGNAQVANIFEAPKQQSEVFTLKPGTVVKFDEGSVYMIHSYGDILLENVNFFGSIIFHLQNLPAYLMLVQKTMFMAIKNLGVDGQIMMKTLMNTGSGT